VAVAAEAEGKAERKWPVAWRGGGEARLRRSEEWEEAECGVEAERDGGEAEAGRGAGGGKVEARQGGAPA
jgi:hypothetical protein